MKIKTCLLTSTIIVLFTASAFSQNTIWRVDNNTGTGADFSTLQEAHDSGSVTSGDTLYVAGSGLAYGSLTLTDSLYIFGPGFFLTENPDTQAKPVSAKTGSITFNSGSRGSLITGLEISGVVDINVNNVVLKRNFLTGTSSNAIEIAASVSNIIITQNYIHQTNVTGTSRAIDVGANGQNIIITNNYVESDDAGASARLINAHTSASCDLRNNVMEGNGGATSVEVYNTIFYNNILMNGGFSGTTNDIQNNIGDASQFGVANGNQSNVVMSNVFLLAGSTDGQWQLAVGSPAIAAGISGGNIGMFGGSGPYVLSGLPVIPAVYFFSAPTSGSTSSGLPVQIKIKSHN